MGCLVSADATTVWRAKAGLDHHVKMMKMPYFRLFATNTVACTTALFYIEGHNVVLIELDPSCVTRHLLRSCGIIL